MEIQIEINGHEFLIDYESDGFNAYAIFKKRVRKICTDKLSEHNMKRIDHEIEKHADQWNKLSRADKLWAVWE